MKGMKPVPFDERLFSAYLAEAGCALVQPKLDGIHAYWDGEDLRLPSGEICKSVPHIEEALETMFGGTPVEGELYAHGVSREKIQGLVCRLNPARCTRQIGLHIFDLCIPAIPQKVRLRALASIPVEDWSPHVEIVPCHEVTDYAGAQTLLRGYLQDGYEGVVVRNPLASWCPGRRRCLMKLKPGGRDTYPILRVRSVSGQVEALMLARPDDEGESFSVPVRGELRTQLWPARKLLPGRKARVSYSNLTARGVPVGARVTSIEGGIPVPEQEAQS